MPATTTTAAAYDEVPFPSQAVAQSHPDRLAAIARLFGLRAPAIERCRVLELGCAAGDNLIPVADRLPECTCLGVDFSGVQVATGLRTSQALGLTNIELRRVDIRQLGDELGTFDYIVCHGLYSWVPGDVQQRMLSLCHDLLAPNGVAYASYNIYPGWHLAGIVRELLIDHVADGSARQRQSHGRALLEFFSAALADEAAPFCRLLKSDVDALLRQNDSYWLHEHLEPDNHPVWFAEFVARAEAAGLQYLGDALPATMFVASFGPEVERHIRQLANDDVSIEQHLDVLRNRPFRQSLLCHQGIRLERHFAPERLAELYFAGQLTPLVSAPDLHGTAEVRFATPRGLGISSDVPMVKSVLYHLGAQWPRAFSLDALLAAAAPLAPGAEPPPVSSILRDKVASKLVECLRLGLLDVTSAPDAFVTSVSSRPQASRLARVQCTSTRFVTNRRHEGVGLDDVEVHILPYLDGRHDRAALERIVREFVDRGKPSRGGGTGGMAPRRTVEDTLERCLTTLAASALLVG